MPDDEFSSFWFATWSVWRSGQLSSISANFEKYAAADFRTFTAEYPGDQYSQIKSFFGASPPLHGEFLITFYCHSGQPVFVVTNQRLWIYAPEERGHLAFNLSEIAKLETSKGWRSTKVRIVLKDGTQRELADLTFSPKDDYVGRVLERCASPEGWKIAARETQSSDETAESAAAARAGATGAYPALPFPLVFVAATVFILLTWWHRLSQPGGFILVIGAIAGGWSLAKLMSRR